MSGRLPSKPRDPKKKAAHGSRHFRCHSQNQKRPALADRISIVAVDLLATLVSLLRFDRQRGDRARVEAFERDGLAGLFAVAVSAFLDAVQRGIDLGDQLALAVTCPELDCPIGLG